MIPTASFRNRFLFLNPTAVTVTISRRSSFGYFIANLYTFDVSILSVGWLK